MTQILKESLLKLESSTLSLGVLFTMSLVANALLLRYLGLESFSSSASLGMRGLSCLMITILYALSQRQSLKVKNPKFQSMRAILAGFSLLAIISSYHFVYASTVTLLQRLDILILCLLGLHASTRKDTKLHVWAIILSFAVVTYLLRDSSEKIEGYFLAALGASGIALGYVFMKKSQAIENFSVTIAVPSLSSIILGICLGPSAFIEAFSSPLVFVALASGVFMFVSYYLTLKLYQRMNMATAEFPTLLATTLVMPLEKVFFGRYINPGLFIFDFGVVLWLSWLLGVPQHFIRKIQPLKERQIQNCIKEEAI